MSERDELNELLNDAVEVAADHLASRTEFAPFALALQAEDGEVFHIEPDEDDLGPDQSLIVAALRGGLREAAAEGRWRAVAVVADVTIEDDNGEAVTSAIRIWLEHEEVEPIACTIPYDIGHEVVDLGDLLAEPGESFVFVVAPPPN